MGVAVDGGVEVDGGGGGWRDFGVNVGGIWDDYG